MWTAKRPFRDRINFTFAAFNAGAGNMLKAQEAAKERGLNPNLWPSILIGLPQVTGKHSKETINYVKKINQIKEVLR
jgi:membrane-bound lytic murein transglycosylase F